MVKDPDISIIFYLPHVTHILPIYYPHIPSIDCVSIGNFFFDLQLRRLYMIKCNLMVNHQQDCDFVGF